MLFADWEARKGWQKIPAEKLSALRAAAEQILGTRCHVRQLSYRPVLEVEVDFGDQSS